MSQRNTHASGVIEAASILLERLASSSIAQHDANDTRIAVTRLIELLRGPNASPVRNARDSPDNRTRRVNNNNASPQAVLDRLDKIEERYLRPITESTRKAGVSYADIAR